MKKKRQKEDELNSWEPEQIDVKLSLDKLFSDFDRTKSLLNQIKEGVELKEVKIENYTFKSTWESLRFIIDLIQQIRNNGNSVEDDNFLYSPVRMGNGFHFDTRNALSVFPTDADANGAVSVFL